MTALKRLYIRIDDRATNAALDINNNRRRLATTCTLHHRIPRGAWMALAGAAAATLAGNRLAVFGLLAVLAAAAGIAQTVLERAHEIAVAYPGHPCSRCPQPDEDDGRGDGGAWLDTAWDDDIPPAPGPMADYDDDQIAAMAGDLDLQMLALHDAWKDSAFK